MRFTIVLDDGREIMWEDGQVDGDDSLVVPVQRAFAWAAPFMLTAEGPLILPNRLDALSSFITIVYTLGVDIDETTITGADALIEQVNALVEVPEEAGNP